MNSSLTLQSIVTATPEQVSCALGDESSILSLKNSVYYSLDPVGTRIWELLRQSRSVGKILEVLLQEYDVAPDRCERDLFAILEKLLQEGLIEVRDVQVALE
jgi:hypothetical protein